MTAKLATYADLLALPEDVRAEVIAGEVLTQPSAPPRHSKVQGALRGFVGQPFDDDDGRGGPGGWWIFVEVDVALGEHEIVRPDLAGWRRGRLPSPGTKRPIGVRAERRRALLVDRSGSARARSARLARWPLDRSGRLR